MAKKGVQHATPPKKYYLPADIKALGNYGKTIANAIYGEFAKRMQRK